MRTGFGVAEHKVLKNIACSTGIADFYAGHDYVTPRIDAEARIVEVPRLAGVALALTVVDEPGGHGVLQVPARLMTRSVVVVSRTAGQGGLRRRRPTLPGRWYQRPRTASSRWSTSRRCR